MTRRPSVFPFLARPLDGASADLRYDGVVGAVGYETRCKRIPLELADVAAARAGLGFTDHVELARPHHEEVAAAGYEILTLKPDHLTGWMRQWLSEVAAESPDPTEPLRIAIDISSFSRVRVARLIEALHTHPIERPVRVDFLYTPASYESPLEQPEITEVHGPVTNWFAGWTNSNGAVVAFIGIGYDEDRALGAVEYLEPGDVWAFVPEGEDVQYDERLRRANEWVFEELAPDRLVHYRVDDPFEFLSQMEGLVADELAQQRRPVLLPLGPKMFSACALLVALRNRPWTAVWRISPGAYAKPLDCDSNGKLVGISASFSPRG